MKVINFFITTGVIACGLIGFEATVKGYGKSRAKRMVAEMKQTGVMPDKKEFF